MKYVSSFLLFFLLSCSSYNNEDFTPNELSYTGTIDVIKNNIILTVTKNEYSNSKNLVSKKIKLIPVNNEINKLILFIKKSHIRKVKYFTIIGKLSKNKEGKYFNFLVSTIKSDDKFGSSFNDKYIN